MARHGRYVEPGNSAYEYATPIIKDLDKESEGYSWTGRPNTAKTNRGVIVALIVVVLLSAILGISLTM